MKSFRLVVQAGKLKARDGVEIFIYAPVTKCDELYAAHGSCAFCVASYSHSRKIVAGQQ